MRGDRHTRRRERRQRWTRRREEEQRLANMSTITMIFAFAAFFILLGRTIPLKSFDRAIDITLDLFWMGAALMLLGLLFRWSLGVVQTSLHHIGIALCGALLTSGLIWYMVAYPSAIAPAREMFLIDPRNPQQIPLAHVQDEAHAYRSYDRDFFDDIELSLLSEHVLLDARKVTYDRDDLHAMISDVAKRKQRENELLRRHNRPKAVLTIDRCMPFERPYHVTQALATHDIWPVYALVHSPTGLSLQWLPSFARPVDDETYEEEEHVEPIIEVQLSLKGVEMTIQGESAFMLEPCDESELACAQLTKRADETCEPTWGSGALTERARQVMEARFDATETQSYTFTVSSDVPTHHVISTLDALRALCKAQLPDDREDACRPLLEPYIRLVP